jgi:hypothetical protein
MSRPAEVVVAGVGRFGRRAVRELSARHPGWRIHAIEHDPAKLKGLSRHDWVELHPGEAVTVLDRLLQERSADWIVPAVPFHLAHAWLLHALARHHEVRRIPVPDSLVVPNPYRGRTGDLYTSFAAFLCPEDCPEPKGACTVTGERRSMPLFQLLADLPAAAYRVVGLRSRQLGAGVGGYRGRELLALKEEILNGPGDLLLFTACRCHGVLSGLHVGPPKR